jgi:cell wall-associated NlpC family hydrolase
MRRYALLALALPAALSAQTISLTPYGAIDQSLSTRPLLLGTSLALTMGPISLRGSGSVAHANWMKADSNFSETDSKVRAFAGDVDLVINPGRNAGASGTFGALEPRLFAGYGVRGEAIPGGTTQTHKVVSVGTVLSYSVLSRVRFDVEARRLAPADAIGDLFEDGTGAWEYRAGLALHFGKGNLRPTSGILNRYPSTGGGGGGGGGTTASRGRTVMTPAAGTLLATADSKVGIPYYWGGTTPNPGFDCSGFVQTVFRAHGVELPRTSREMALMGQSVGRDISALKPGDLMFFAQDGGRISHVAIYAGNNMMIHSSSSGNGVGYDDLTTSRGAWYQRIYVGGQRVLGVPVQSVTLAGGQGGSGNRGRQGGLPTQQLAGAGASGPGISAFLRAAGMRDLSDVAKRLYRPDEKPDAPDGAPKRRF